MSRPAAGLFFFPRVHPCLLCSFQFAEPAEVGLAAFCRRLCKAIAFSTAFFAAAISSFVYEGFVPIVCFVRNPASFSQLMSLLKCQAAS